MIYVVENTDVQENNTSWIKLFDFKHYIQNKCYLFHFNKTGPRHLVVLVSVSGASVVGVFILREAEVQLEGDEADDAGEHSFRQKQRPRAQADGMDEDLYDERPV